MVKVISKGYTLSVTSWENDGDSENTKSKTFDTKEEAIKIAKMCKVLFRSRHRLNGGIGNIIEGDEAREVILNYLKENPDFFENQSEMNDDDLTDGVMNINTSLLGSSEYYYSRVFDSGIITYSPKDIYLEEVKF